LDNRVGIERNVEALKRILVSLVALAGLDETTLPRHLHRAILRLLRPAESAARRLIIAYAATPQARETGYGAMPQAREIADKATPSAREMGNTEAHEQGNGVAASAWRWQVRKAAGRRARQFQPRTPRPEARPAVTRLSLPLADPLPRSFRRVQVRQASVPRLWIYGSTQARLPIPSPPAPDDPLDATRLRLRLDALGRALDDLPGQALRFARWRARQASMRGRGRFRRPLRPGRPPGALSPGNRRREHEVHAVLAHAHSLGWWALERRDTS
jgi:hypothetical protein